MTFKDNLIYGFNILLAVVGSLTIAIIVGLIHIGAVQWP